ncbi:MAG: hypothetical protein WBG48_08200 [Pricia sp.]
MKKNMEIITYDVEKYNFPKIISDFLNMGDLDTLQPEFADEPSGDEDSLYKNMERTKAYSQLYAALNSDKGKRFYDTYNLFIEEVLRPHFGDAIYYQAKPTHRILYANAPGVSRFHRDRDYGHNTDEVNFFVPQTQAFATNTLWIESEEGKEDFKPVEIGPGEFLKFDGANLMHGAKANISDKTRVSFDFRILPAHLAKTTTVQNGDSDTKDLQKALNNNAHNFILAK